MKYSIVLTLAFAAIGLAAPNPAPTPAPAPVPAPKPAECKSGSSMAVVLRTNTWHIDIYTIVAGADEGDSVEEK